MDGPRNVLETNYYISEVGDDGSLKLTKEKGIKSDYKMCFEALQSISSVLEKGNQVTIRNEVVHLKKADDINRIKEVAKEIAKTYRDDHQDGVIVHFFKQLFRIKGKADQLDELSQKIQDDNTLEIAKRCGFDPEKFQEHKNPHQFLVKLDQELKALKSNGEFSSLVIEKPVEEKHLFYTKKTFQIDREKTLEGLSQIILGDPESHLISSTESPCISAFLTPIRLDLLKNMFNQGASISHEHLKNAITKAQTSLIKSFFEIGITPSALKGDVSLLKLAKEKDAEYSKKNGVSDNTLQNLVLKEIEKQIETALEKNEFDTMKDLLVEEYLENGPQETQKKLDFLWFLMGEANEKNSSEDIKLLLGESVFKELEKQTKEFFKYFDPKGDADIEQKIKLALDNNQLIIMKNLIINKYLADESKEIDDKVDFLLTLVARVDKEKNPELFSFLDKLIEDMETPEPPDPSKE